jgi:DNA-binding Lrp family transcriptional regulator
MTTIEPLSTEHSLNADIMAMVNQIGVIGPKVPEIARRLGRHRETVRYWYKKLEANDFAIQAIINHEALGLKRIIMKVQFGEGYRDYVKPMMFAMNELCYVTSYAKALPEDVYIIHASVPSERAQDYLDFADALKEQGIFKSVDSYLFDWFRNVPMKGDLYDFETGHWEFDLPSLVKKDVPFTQAQISPKVRFDRTDLLIAKELQIDATREMQEIQQAIKENDKVEINYKTLCWHLSEHVQDNNLLKGYRINWMGSRWDRKADRARHRSHSYVVLHVFVKGPTEDEKMAIMKMMNRLPIVWSEAAGTDYFAEIAVPSEMTIEALEFLQGIMSPVRDRASYHIMDQRNATGFTFSYNLFDEASKSWKFNKEELLTKFRMIEHQIRQV